jgi:putative hydrolase
LGAAIDRSPAPAVLAHPFSNLPKIGITEADVPDDALRALAAACRASGTAIEVNEKWGCPGAPIVATLLDERVTIVAGSDAHHADAVGRWDRVRATLTSAVALSARRHATTADRLAAPTG